MNQAKSRFIENIVRARELGQLALSIEALVTAAIDVSDIYRSQIVLSVSALDSFVHDIVRVGMIEISKGARSTTDSYLRFQLPMSAYNSGVSGVLPETWLGETIRQKHSFQSFQKPEKIAEAIRLISSLRLWDEVAKKLGKSENDIKTKLELIVDRRNKIAHEADIDPTNPISRWPISSSLANETIDFIEKVGLAISGLVL